MASEALQSRWGNKHHTGNGIAASLRSPRWQNGYEWGGIDGKSSDLLRWISGKARNILQATFAFGLRYTIEPTLQNITHSAVASSRIEGEYPDRTGVRETVARSLWADAAIGRDWLQRYPAHHSLNARLRQMVDRLNRDREGDTTTAQCCY